MIVSRLSDYLRERGIASLAEMANGLDSTPAALEPMLAMLERKGRVRHLAKAVSTCGTCCECDPSTLDFYEWANKDGMADDANEHEESSGHAATLLPPCHAASR